MPEEEKLDWKLQYTPWIILGLIYIAINYFIVTPQSADFNVGIVYGLSAIIMAEMLYFANRSKKSNSWGMLLGALFSCLPLIVSSGSLNATTGMYLAVIGIIVIYYLNSQEHIGKYLDEVKYFALVPMVTWMLWSLLYINAGLSDPALLPYQTLLYHGAILLFAGFSTLRFLGIAKDDEQSAKASMILVVIAGLGMLLLTQQLGWALTTLCSIFIM